MKNQLGSINQIGSILTRQNLKDNQLAKITGGNNLGCHDLVSGLYNKCINGICRTKGTGVCNTNTSFVCVSTAFDYCCCTSVYANCTNDSDCGIH